MYIRKQPPKRYLTTVRGKKQTSGKFKKIILLILVLGLVFGAYYGVKNASAINAAIKRPQWTQWRLAKIRVSGVGRDTALEAGKYITFTGGQSITHADCVGMEKNILQNMPYLESVSVSRNFFNKELTVKLKKHVKIAKVNTEYKMLYLAQNGALFADKPSAQDSALFTVTLKGKIKSEFLPKELVELIKELNVEKRVKFVHLVFDSDKQTCDLVDPYVSVALGDIETYRQKLKVLFLVLQSAQSKDYKMPYKVNLQYFKEGKVYLTPTLQQGANLWQKQI